MKQYYTIQDAIQDAIKASKKMRLSLDAIYIKSDDSSFDDSDLGIDSINNGIVNLTPGSPDVANLLILAQQAKKSGIKKYNQIKKIQIENKDAQSFSIRLFKRYIVINASLDKSVFTGDFY